MSSATPINRSADAGLTLDYEPIGAKGRVRITVRLPDGTSHTDKIDIAVAKERAAFLAALRNRYRGIDRSQVEAELERIAAEVVAKAAPDGVGEGEARAGTQADRVAAMVLESAGVDLFHTPDGEAYATLPVARHRETWRVNSRPFREWLSRRFYQESGGKVPASQALHDAINAVTGKARYQGPERPVSVRIAEHGGDIWLDLCDATWRAVRITAGGWSLLESTEVPAAFIRRKGMQALPAPVRGGSLEDLRPLVNVNDDEQWTLVIGWLVGAFHPSGPYGVLAVTGEQGCAKSTLCRLLRRLIDPNDADLRRPPTTERDAFIAAGNSWVCSYNNLSGLRPDIADALCALATDGGFATRTLFENDDETFFTARRPVILNGIDDVTARPDLLDRTLAVTLEPIPEDRRLLESDILARFDAVRPGLLGALLDAVSAAMRNRSQVVMRCKPRMADLAVWVAAAEPALGWRPGRFLAALTANRAGTQTLALEASPVGAALLRLVDARPFRGTATELLEAINAEMQPARPPRGWPETPKALGTVLRRLAPSLRAAGVQVEFVGKPTGHRKRREITLARTVRPVSMEDADRCGPPADRSSAATVRADCGVVPPGAAACNIDADHVDRADHADRSTPARSNGNPGPAPAPADALPCPDAPPLLTTESRPREADPWRR